eukprot:g2543.t1
MGRSSQRPKKQSLEALANTLRSAKSRDQLIKALRSAEAALIALSQECEKTNGLDSVASCFVIPRILKHRDGDVCILTASCLVEIFRIYAPDAPYSNDEIIGAFSLIVQQFGAFQSEMHGPKYDRLLRILNSLATVRSCVMLAEIACGDESDDEEECDDDDVAAPNSGPMIEMFNVLILCLQKNHALKLEQLICNVILSCLEFIDTDQLEPRVLDALCVYLLPPHQRRQRRYNLVLSILGNARIQNHVSAYARGLASGEVPFDGKRFRDISSSSSITPTKSKSKNRNKNSGGRKVISMVLKHLAKASPDTMMYALPTLCAQLEDIDENHRAAVVRLLGELFISERNNFPESNNTDFRRFLQRTKDTSEEIRITMANCCGILLFRRPTQRKLIQPELSVALRENSDDVRRKAVGAICKAAQENFSSVPEKLLRELASHACTEKNVVTAREACTGLAQIYKARRAIVYDSSKGQVDDSMSSSQKEKSESDSDVSTTEQPSFTSFEQFLSRKIPSKICWVPYAVLNLTTRKEPALRERLMQLIDDIFLPRNENSRDRTFELIKFHMSCVKDAQKDMRVLECDLVQEAMRRGVRGGLKGSGRSFVGFALISIFKVRSRLRNGFLEFLNLRAQWRDVSKGNDAVNTSNDELSKKISAKVILLAKNAYQITEGISEFQLRKIMQKLCECKDQCVFQLFETLLDPSTKLLKARRTRSDLVKRLNAAFSRAKIGDKIKPVLRFLTRAVFNHESISLLLNTLVELPAPEMKKQCAKDDDENKSDSEDHNDDYSDEDGDDEKRRKVDAANSCFDLIELAAKVSPSTFSGQSEALLVLLEKAMLAQDCREEYTAAVIKVIANVCHPNFFLVKRKGKKRSKRDINNSSDSDGDVEYSLSIAKKILSHLKEFCFGRNFKKAYKSKGKKNKVAEFLPPPSKSSLASLAAQTMTKCFKTFSANDQRTDWFDLHNRFLHTTVSELKDELEEIDELSFDDISIELPSILSSFAAFASEVPKIYFENASDSVNTFINEKCLRENLAEYAKGKKRSKAKQKKFTGWICAVKAACIDVLVGIIKGKNKAASKSPNELPTLSILAEALENDGNLLQNAEEEFVEERQTIRRATSKGMLELLSFVRFEDSPRYFLAVAAALRDSDDLIRASHFSLLTASFARVDSRRKGPLSSLLLIPASDDVSYIQKKAKEFLAARAREMQQVYTIASDQLARMPVEARNHVSQYLVPEIATFPMTCFLVSNFPELNKPNETLPDLLRARNAKRNGNNNEEEDSDDDDDDDALGKWMDAIDIVEASISPLIDALWSAHRNKNDKLSSYSVLTKISEELQSYQDSTKTGRKKKSKLSNLSLVAEIAQKIIARRTKKMQLDPYPGKIVLNPSFFTKPSIRRVSLPPSESQSRNRRRRSASPVPDKMFDEDIEGLTPIRKVNTPQTAKKSSSLKKKRKIDKEENSTSKRGRFTPKSIGKENRSAKRKIGEK